MTSTDRAFIAAIQQASSGLNGGATLPTTEAGDPTLAAPHFATATSAAPTGRAAKAPLSEHLARRREAAERAPARPAAKPATRPSSSISVPPLRPGVEVDSIRWPEIVNKLGVEARQQLLNLLSKSTRAGETAEAPAIAFVSSTAGVGGTTALLATASLIASVGGKVAILDLTSADGAAAQLGVRRVAHLDGRLDATAIDDLLVTSRDQGTSVLAADGPRLAEAALQRLSATHDLVLIDVGTASSTTEFLTTDFLAPVAVLLVDSVDAVTRGPALKELAQQSIHIDGIVETFADVA